MFNLLNIFFSLLFRYCCLRIIKMTSLEVESNLVHEKKKLLKCDKCTKKFISEERLKWHFATIHEGNKPYQCVYCEKMFALKQSLKNHIMNAHDGGTFDCSECSESFVDKAPFKAHFLAHLYDKSLCDLPDEVVLKIISYLNLKGLAQCAQVSKRLRNICKDVSLWETMTLNENLYRNNGPFQENDGPYQMIPASFIRHILDNGCKYLTICQAELIDGINLPKTSQLKNFAIDDMYGDRTIEAVEEILSTANCLEVCQLDFMGTFQMENLIKNIFLKNSKTLTVLKLEIVTLTSELVKNIVNFTELKELSIAYPDIRSRAIRSFESENTPGSVNNLVRNISPEIKKISFNGMKNFGNDQMKTLVTRCKKLEELSLRDTSITLRMSVPYIVENCFNLVKLDLSSSLNDLHDFANEQELVRSGVLRAMPKLKNFVLYNM